MINNINNDISKLKSMYKELIDNPEMANTPEIKRYLKWKWEFIVLLQKHPDLTYDAFLYKKNTNIFIRVINFILYKVMKVKRHG